jgi:hypothetical protein
LKKIIILDDAKKIQDGRRFAVAILDFFYKSKGTCYSCFCPKLGNKFRKDRSSGLKVIDIKKIKMAAILQSPSWILKMNIAGNILVAPKLATKFRKDRLNGLKVIAISKMPTFQCQ